MKKKNKKTSVRLHNNKRVPYSIVHRENEGNVSSISHEKTQTFTLRLHLLYCQAALFFLFSQLPVCRVVSIFITITTRKTIQ